MRLVVRTLVLALTALMVGACGDDRANSGSGAPGTLANRDCSIRFGLTDNTPFSVLEVEIDYRRAPGSFLGLGADVECTRLTDQLTVFVSNWNCDAQGHCYGREQSTLHVEALAGRNFASPRDLVACRFAASDVPEPTDFDVEIVDVSDEKLQAVIPPPAFAITSVDCREAGGTTTTTTLVDPCEGVACGDDAACSDGRCVPATSYELTFGVDTAATFGALGFDVTYDCRDGRIDGEAFETACAVNPSLNVHAAFNNRSCDPRRDTARLSAAIIAGPGHFDGPVIVASCRYTSVAGAAPDTDQFEITVVDASDPSFVGIPEVTVSVHGVRAVAP